MLSQSALGLKHIPPMTTVSLKFRWESELKSTAFMACEQFVNLLQSASGNISN